MREPVDDPPADLAQATGLHERARHVVLATPDDHVEARLDDLEQAFQLLRRIREVGVGERDRAARWPRALRCGRLRPCRDSPDATSTRSAPAARAASAVPSVDPSSTTMSSTPPSTFARAERTAAIADAIRSCSSYAGTTTLSRTTSPPRRRLGSSSGRARWSRLSRSPPAGIGSGIRTGRTASEEDGERDADAASAGRRCTRRRCCRSAGGRASTSG